MSKKIYYKVVNTQNNGIFSAMHYNLSKHNMSVEYKLGEWTYPAIEDTKLMVFTNVMEALNFASIWGKDTYECEIKNPQRKAPYIGDIFSSNFKNSLLKLIKIKKQKKKYFIRPSFHSALFCGAVKLTKRIH